MQKIRARTLPRSVETIVSFAWYSNSGFASAHPYKALVGLCSINSSLTNIQNGEVHDTVIVNNVTVTPSSGFGHASFIYTTPSGMYPIGAFVERVDNGSYDVVAFVDPFKSRLSIACPTSVTGQLTFNIVVMLRKSS